jgi:HTH-type transcriptional regulator, transcriptional repressor of NAD biosynthesis genes
MKHGIVIGRFLPFHAGHAATIRTAMAMVDRLTILLCSASDDRPGEAVRLRWLRDTFPALRIVALPAPSPHRLDEMRAPALPWRELIGRVHPEPVDVVFASDPRQAVIADALGARLLLVDPRHEAVPVRSADIRAHPHTHWRYLPPAVRPAYARTICLHGPESTGKSTLAARLARHFDTLFVPEYGRTYCEQFGNAVDMDDLVTIGRTHAALTQALLQQCNRLLILDTDPLMTAVWADMMLGRRDPWFDAFDGPADLYLLLDIDMPFVDDGLRIYGQTDERQRFFDLSLRELERRGAPYRIIGGAPEERFAGALDAIAQEIGS